VIRHVDIGVRRPIVPWSPDQLNPAGWFVADDLTVGAVSSWQGRVGAPLTQPTAGYQPVCSAGVFGSHNGVAFAAASTKHLLADNFLSVLTGQNWSISFWMICPSLASYSCWLGWGNSATTTPYAMAYLQTTTRNSMFYSRDNAGASVSATNGAVPQDTPALLTFSRAGNTVSMYINDVFGVAADLSALGAQTIDQLRVGVCQRTTGFLYPANGSLSNILILDRPISQIELTKLNTWLSINAA
jgi:hypothetical protein